MGSGSCFVVGKSSDLSRNGLPLPLAQTWMLMCEPAWPMPTSSPPGVNQSREISAVSIFPSARACKCSLTSYLGRAKKARAQNRDIHTETAITFMFKRSVTEHVGGSQESLRLTTHLRCLACPSRAVAFRLLNMA